MTYGECVLEAKLSLRETLHLLRAVEKPVLSRFWFGSPCRFVRQMDVLIHIVVPELLERRLPRLAHHLRRSSPRWGRSWRDWQRGGAPSSTRQPDQQQ